MTQNISSLGKPYPPKPVKPKKRSPIKIQAFPTITRLSIMIKGRRVGIGLTSKEVNALIKDLQTVQQCRAQGHS